MYKCFSYNDSCQQGMFMKQRMDAFKYMCLSTERKVNVKTMIFRSETFNYFNQGSQLSRILFSLLYVQNWVKIT